jgi:hypothetical protein
MMVVAALVAFATIGVSQSTQYSFTIHNPGSSRGTVTHAISFADKGSFRFAWTTVGGAGVNFTVRVGSSGTPIYSVGSTSGSGTLQVAANTQYVFGIQDVLAATASVNGTLAFSAPILSF